MICMEIEHLFQRMNMVIYVVALLYMSDSSCLLITVKLVMPSFTLCCMTNVFELDLINLLLK